MRLHNTLRKIHLTLALSVGLLFIFSGFTGAVLAFGKEWDSAANASLLHVQPEGEPLGLDILLANAESAFHDGRWVFAIESRETLHDAQKFLMRKEGMSHHGAIEVYMNPYTGQVIGERRSGQFLASWLYMVHHTMFIGGLGKKILGYAAWGMLALVVIGLWLNRPLNRQGWRWFRIKRGSRALRRLWDWHRNLGTLAAAGYLLVLPSTVFLVFPAATNAVVGVFSPLTPAPDAGEVKAQGFIGAEALLESAAREFPHSHWFRLYLDKDKDAKTPVLYLTPDAAREQGFSYERAIFHPTTGKVLETRRWENATAGDALLSGLFRLHGRLMMGSAGKALVMLLGVLPLFFLITGLWRWWLKKKYVKINTSS